MSGAHGGHDGQLRLPAASRRALAITIAIAAVLTIVGLIALRPVGGDRADDFDETGFPAVAHDGVLVGIRNCPGADPLDCQLVDVRMAAGPDEGEVITVRELTVDELVLDARIGERLVLSYEPNPDLPREFQYRLIDRARKPVLVWLAVAFGAAVLALGRWRGVSALLGLGTSLIVLIIFTVPAIVDGRPPVLVAAVSASAIAFAALYLTHGIGPMSTVALLGTLGALLLALGAGWAAVELAQFSGLASDSAVFIRVLGPDIDLRGLLLAGLVIGALGAIDDVTVTQASVVFELKASNPAAAVSDLVRSGLRVGRDHIASTVNTLALAYAGAALPLAILLVEADQSLGTVANAEVVAVEIVRTLVGGMALVAAVPLTTWLAAVVATDTAAREAPDDFDDLRRALDDD
ncbi:MAG: YibE/F family protein [Actinomycetota bacterium]